MSADIIMDLYADFASECAKELQAAGYTPLRPRKVHQAAYAVSVLAR